MRTFAVIIALLAVCLALPNFAHAEGTASIISLYAFDPAVGKARGQASFTWPANQKLSAILRFSTGEYESRKTVELFLVLTNRQGQVIRKHSAQLTLAAGEHEYVMPEIFRIEEMFISDRIFLEGEVKLAGGPREDKKVEIVINGPAVPRVVIDSLKIVDPRTDKPLDGVEPGQKFKALGIVSVSGNSTKLLPDLVVWAVMSNDTLKSDPWTQDQFSDTFWDRATLGAPNGKWRFSIEAQAPEFFNVDKPGSQPFMLNFAVEFTPETKTMAQLGGTVNPGRGQFQTHKDLQLRLMRLERNWRWEIKVMR